MTGRPDAATVLADLLLQREALVCRLADGRPPRDFAGMYVGPEDLDRILATLPGLDGPAPSLTAEVRKRTDPELNRARTEFRSMLDGAAPLAVLARTAGLAPSDAEVLALLGAVETSPARQRLVAYVQDSVQQPLLTVATLARIFADPDHPADRCVASGSPLRRAELVEVAAEGPWATRACGLPARVVWHLRGDGSADVDLPPGTVRLPATRDRTTTGANSSGDGGSSAGAPAGAAAVNGTVVGDRTGGLADSGLLLVHGGDRESRLQAVERHWPDQGRLICPMPETGAQWAAVVREATLGNLVVVLQSGTAPDAAGADVVVRSMHLNWVLSTPGELPLESVPVRPWREIRVAGGEAGPEDWRELLGTEPDPAYRLTRGQLRLVAAARQDTTGPLGPAVRRLAGGYLERLAVRIRPRRGWDDLVLPGDDLRQLRELAARHRRRGRVYGDWRFPPLPSTGVVALFSGASGTGKTLAAEVVAGDLGLDLYKVDLSSVVSKYIGETEKNLERIFVAAGAGDLVLFFDEADALFGKRSEVSDARDRYANIEVAYLLQRLESYDGLVVLATNLQRNIDQAFLRRISVAVDFVLPEEPQRRAIWARSFPPSAPVADLDLDFVARQFKISGGLIHNAALGAAFLAADEGDVITMRHVILAIKREFQKLGRLRTEAEFERYFDLVNRDADAAPTR
ncbi:ATP-binding protein [Plantactinospora sp. B24E8]|uniref:ATP-binding protein n=1 Tax=Plantactinospora sp. B24E8 TaxID=3153567 RepID=UPI00325EF191